MDNLALRNKTIVITGASSGTGRAAALTFAQYGASVVLAARNEEVLKEVAAECEELGGRTLVVVTDVSDPRAMINLANAANDWQHKIDIWINNAGVLAIGDFDVTPMEVHQQVIETNLLGYLNGTHAVMPFFKQQQHGILINNISIGGFLPLPLGAGYTASKFGLRGFSEALKGELTAWPGIHVCDLFPFFLDTPGMQHAANYTGKVLRPAPPVYDPKMVAQAMVKLALHPKSDTYVGSPSLLFKFSHALFPELTAKFTAGIMRKYFKVADPIAATNGNLFNTVDYAMSTNGGYGLSGKSAAPIKYIGAAVLAGFVAGFYFIKDS